MRVAILVIILILAAALGFLFWPRGREEAPVEQATTAQGPEVTSVAPATALPRFDIVRVSRGGFAVVAGTGAPGGTVELLANGEVLATETIGADGAWAINVDTPLDAGPVELTLRQSGEAGTAPITSEETVVIYVPETPEDAPVVLRTTPGGATEVLQRATDPATGLGPLAVETIDYDEGGNVIFAGRASAGSAVQVLLNGRPIASATTADENGRWELPAEVRPGRYTLRVVQFGEDGSAAYVVEVPFERAGYEDVEMTDGGVVVQPGNSLWLISRTVYGEGRQYTVIYEANASQIRDPDLIYPGQVFRVPDQR
ncbi:LysM peptidoglycan-binding domain-containing protein [Parvularcula dongshanensis]|uniref:Nucleoid-associated protein YgaU n=1 Tax=Parvularcula dongshanensis TaxID=1173995 RepID=A0A840I5X9_9PROT|nr:LysM peptidoglycan-binding domain-containing protein [Parvularcula dongshanensis]MBB4659548.1 nucleoid-associated protein YgaU [Parvularcula dongshanensis]